MIEPARENEHPGVRNPATTSSMVMRARAVGELVLLRFVVDQLEARQRVLRSVGGASPSPTVHARVQRRRLETGDSRSHSPHNSPDPAQTRP